MIKSMSMRWAEHETRREAKGNAYRILVGKSERKRPLGRQRRRLEDHIHNVMVNSWVAEQLVVSKERLSSVELVTILCSA
jgi:hypothetical protein